VWHIWGREVVHTGFGWGDLRGRYLGVGGRIIIIWIFKRWGREMGRIAVAQDRGRWRTVVNVVMDLVVP